MQKRGAEMREKGRGGLENSDQLVGAHVGGGKHSKVKGMEFERNVGHGSEV